MQARIPQGKPPPDKHVWWRVEIRSYSVCVDPDREEYGTARHIEFHWYEVLRITPKGAWLKTEPFSSCLRHNRWCARDARKRFACPTPVEAAESALARRSRRAKILEATLKSEREIIRRLETIDRDLKRGYGPIDLLNAGFV